VCDVSHFEIDSFDSLLKDQRRKRKDSSSHDKRRHFYDDTTTSGLDNGQAQLRTTCNSVTTIPPSPYRKQQFNMALRLAAAASRSTSIAANTAAGRAFMSTNLDYMRTPENFESVLDRFAQIRACAVLRTATSEACPKAMQAAIDGGFKIVEFTLTTPDW
jgi:hypothetical protein